MPFYYKKRNKLGFNEALTAGIVLSVSNCALAQADEDTVGIGGGLTVVGQALSDQAVAASAEQGGDGTGITYSIDLAFDKELESGNFFLYFIGAQGDPVYPGSNADAEGSAFGGAAGIAEAWYEHSLGEWGGLKLGKIDPTANYDANQFANDQTLQFLADAFVNNLAILFPSYTPGFHTALQFGDVVNLRGGIYEEDVPANETRVEGEMQYKFYIGELGLLFDIFDQDTNLRFTGWSSESYDKSGFAFNLDQTLGDAFGLFMRTGFIGDAVDGERSSTFSIGGQLSFGEGHTAGIGYAADIPAGETFETQSVFESYVNFELASDTYFALDTQLVTAPNYNSQADAVAIFGLRTQVNF